MYNTMDKQLFWTVGLLLLANRVVSQQEGNDTYVTLSFVVQGGEKYETPCSSTTRHTKVMAFNATKVKAANACQCEVQMGPTDQFLNVESFNGSVFNIMEELAVQKGATEAFIVGISSQHDMYIRIQDPEEMDLYEGYSDSLIRIAAKPGPTISVVCKVVPQELIRPMNISDTNSTTDITEEPAPMDITAVVIGIIIGIIVLFVIATLLIFVIFYIKREDAKKYGYKKHTKPGTDYQNVPGAETDEITRRDIPRKNEDPQDLLKAKHLSSRNDPDIETSFSGAKARGRQHADLTVEDDPYRKKTASTPDMRTVHRN